MEVFAKPSKHVDSEDIDITVRFSVPPAEIIRALTDQKMIQFYTRAPATVENKEKGIYRIFDGAILGQFEKIGPNDIEMKWRKRDWEDHVYSYVTIHFEELERGLTEVQLHQTNVPQYDKYGNANVVNNTTIGWTEQIYKQISMMLGYNLILEKDF